VIDAEGVDRVDAGRDEAVNRAVREQDVERLALEVPALHEDVPRPHRRDRARGALHAGGVVHVEARHARCLGEVRRHHRSARE
jgi:hypothetical protein